jgi:hypothetical protein
VAGCEKRRGDRSQEDRGVKNVVNDIDASAFVKNGDVTLVGVVANTFDNNLAGIEANRAVPCDERSSSGKPWLVGTS